MSWVHTKHMLWVKQFILDLLPGNISYVLLEMLVFTLGYSHNNEYQVFHNPHINKLFDFIYAERNHSSLMEFHQILKYFSKFW